MLTNQTSREASVRTYTNGMVSDDDDAISKMEAFKCLSTAISVDLATLVSMTAPRNLDVLPISYQDAKVVAGNM